MNLDTLKEALKEANKIRNKQKVIVAHLTLLEHIKESITIRDNPFTLEYESYFNNTRIYFTPYISKNRFYIMTRLDYENFKDSITKLQND